MLDEALEYPRTSMSRARRFSLTEGAYSASLLDDLSLLESYGIINFEPSKRRCHGAMLDPYELDDETALLDFRFTLSEVDQLVVLLQIPDPFIIDNVRDMSYPATTALCILLFRLVHTQTCREIAVYFKTSRSTISTVLNAVLRLIYGNWSHVMVVNEKQFEASLPRYAMAVALKGGLMHNCVGFIDGTNRECCRPTFMQRVCYSGHKHYHSFKFQSLLTPDGLISHLYGLVPGAHHDVYMFDRSGVQDLFDKPAFHSYCLWADQGYANDGNLFAPFRNPTADEDAINKSMLRVRLSVEHGFMRVSHLFTLFQRPTLLRLGQMAIGQLYATAVFLTNIRTCLDGGNQISKFFECAPPTIVDFLATE